MTGSGLASRMLNRSASAALWKGQRLRTCTILAVCPRVVKVAASPSSSPMSTRTGFLANSIKNNLSCQRRLRVERGLYSSSVDASALDQNPLDILMHVQTRIKQERYQFSPVLSSHRRGPSSNISTLESKATVTMAGQFGRLYRTLPMIQWKDASSAHCLRRQILEFLAVDCGVDREAVDRAVQAYEKLNAPQQGELTPQLTTYNRLHDASAPIYHEILRYLLLDHACQGMESILAIREDLRVWSKSIHATDTERANLLTQLKRLDEHLQEILSVWFVPGLLEHRRITYETTSASILEHIVRNEAVHPVTSLKDLRRRLGPDRRVFAIFHPTLSEQPLFVLYVALQSSVPTSMTTIQEVGQDATDPSFIPPTVACFYSISNLRKGLIGVGMGEYLIHETVERLQKEIPTLETFCTLSPIPGFRQWLETNVNGQEDWILAKHKEVLATALGEAPEVAVTTFVKRLQSWDEPTLSSMPHVGEILLSWAAHYLYHEKHRRKPLDRVARFHISNGAIMDQLHWGADLSRKGWQNSFGLMVTYRYDLVQLPKNQSNFESSNMIPLGESFAKYVQP